MNVSFQRLLKLLTVFVVVLAFDMVTKFLTYKFIPQSAWVNFEYPYGGVPVFQDVLGVDFSISHVTNRGGPWGIVSAYHNVLLVSRIFAVVCLCVHLLFFNEVQFREVPLVLIISGATGNVLDSFFYGHVIDMLHFVLGTYSFPVFNIADSCITVGVVLVLSQAIFTKIKEKKKAGAGPYLE